MAACKADSTGFKVCPQPNEGNGYGQCIRFNNYNGTTFGGDSYIDHITITLAFTNATNVCPTDRAGLTVRDGGNQGLVAGGASAAAGKKPNRPRDLDPDRRINVPDFARRDYESHMNGRRTVPPGPKNMDVVMPSSATLYVYDPKFYVKNQVNWPGNQYMRLYYPGYADLNVQKQVKEDIDGKTTEGYSVHGTQGNVYYCGKDRNNNRFGLSPPTTNAGSTVNALTLQIKADSFGVRTLTEIDTLNPLTLAGVFAGYFNYVIAIFALFLITAKRSPDTYHFALDKPFRSLMQRIDMRCNPWAEPDDSGQESTVFSEGISAGDFTAWDLSDCETFFKRIGLGDFLYVLNDHKVDGHVMELLSMSNFKLFDLPCGLKYLWYISIINVKRDRVIKTRRDYRNEFGEEDPRGWNALVLRDKILEVATTVPGRAEMSRLAHILYHESVTGSVLISQEQGEYVISVHDLQRELEGLPWESEGLPAIGDLMYLCGHLRSIWVKQCVDLSQIKESMHSPRREAGEGSVGGLLEDHTPLGLLEEEMAATLAALAEQFEATKQAQTEYFEKKKNLLAASSPATESGASQPGVPATFEVEVSVDDPIKEAPGDRV